MAGNDRPGPLTEDRLLAGRIAIRQPKHGFRVSLDSVLLSASIACEDGQRVLEPGAGVGGAALMLAARVPGCSVVGLEAQRALVGIAGENIRLNGMTGRVDIVMGDLGSPPSRLALGAFDHVMMNPPYHRAGSTHAPAEASRAASHVEGDSGLEDWIAFGVSMLRGMGTLTLIHRADRLADVLAALHGRAGEIVVFPLWPRGDGSPAKRIIVRARRGTAAPLRIAQGLILHERDGSFTPEADRICRGGDLDV